MARGTNDQQERLMNAYRTALFAAMFVAGIAANANAQGMAPPHDTMAAPAAKSDSMAAPKDSMAMNKPMKHGMKQGSMKHDSMKHDAMKSDSMAGPSH
jgi:pentapeptide MXKDX repeat protein